MVKIERRCDDGRKDQVCCLKDVVIYTVCSTVPLNVVQSRTCAQLRTIYVYLHLHLFVIPLIY